MGYMLFTVGGAAIAVSITVAIFLAVTIVLAILAVAVVIAVFLLFHIQPVDDGAQIGQTIIVVQLVDQLVIVLMCIIGAADIDTGVGHTSYKLRVGHHADRGGVKHDIIVILFQYFNGIF